MSDFHCYGCNKRHKGEPAWRTGGAKRTYCSACQDAYKRKTYRTEAETRNGYRQTAKTYLKGKLPMNPGVLK